MGKLTKEELSRISAALAKAALKKKASFEDSLKNKTTAVWFPKERVYSLNYLDGNSEARESSNGRKLFNVKQLLLNTGNSEFKLAAIISDNCREMYLCLDTPAFGHICIHDALNASGMYHFQTDDMIGFEKIQLEFKKTGKVRTWEEVKTYKSGEINRVIHDFLSSIPDDLVVDFTRIPVLDMESKQVLYPPVDEQYDSRGMFGGCLSTEPYLSAEYAEFHE